MSDKRRQFVQIYIFTLFLAFVLGVALILYGLIIT